MTIAEYQELTGITVSTADETRVKAAIRKSEVRLGTLLGYSLTGQQKWTELGKVRYNGFIPFPSLPVSEEALSNLTEADEQTGDIQLFNFDELDKHIRINPAKEAYRAKIVLPVNRDEFITIYDMENATPYLNSGACRVQIRTKRTRSGWRFCRVTVRCAWVKRSN